MPSTATGMGGFTTISDAVASLDATYAVQATLNTHGSETAVLLVDYTNGAETSVDVLVEAWDATNGWHIVPFSSTAFPLNMTADSTERWMIRRLARWETQIRVSLKADTSTSDTSVTVKVQLGHSRYPIAGNITS